MSAALTLEVTVRWAGDLLDVVELTPPRDYTIGEAPCDFVLPGVGRLRLVRATDEAVVLVVPPNAQASAGTPAMPLAAGPHPLAIGDRACVAIARFQISLSLAPAVRVAFRPRLQPARAGYFAGSALSAMGVLATLAYAVPPSGLEPDEVTASDRRYTLRQYLASAAEREVGQDGPTQSERTTRQEGATGSRAKGVEGGLGKPLSGHQDRRYRLAGPKPARVPNAGSVDEARSFGMLGLLARTLGDARGLVAPWRGLVTAGTGPTQAYGELWSSQPGDAFGTGGLALSGIGEGGGGRGEGIGLGHDGVGNGAGTGSGVGFGRGEGPLWSRGGFGTCGGGGETLERDGVVVWQRFYADDGCSLVGGGQGFGPGTDAFGYARKAPPGKDHVARAPRVQAAPLQSPIRCYLPPEVIQRVVRQSFGRFRGCYQQGLVRDPSLAGRVSVRFVIARDGSVAHATDSGSDLPSRTVVECVVHAFYGLSFPEPEGGVVTITYPIVFSPA